MKYYSFNFRYHDQPYRFNNNHSSQASHGEGNLPSLHPTGRGERRDGTNYSDQQVERKIDSISHLHL